MINELVVLVDEEDNKIGLMDKFEAHRGEGKLHRAISVLLWRDGKNGKEVLLQKRATTKLLWPLYWTNTICTHPRDVESHIDCAVRRLSEEMGISVDKNSLKLIYKQLYQAKYDENFSEYELDGVIVGEWNGVPKPNPDEAADWKWLSWRKLKIDLIKRPKFYTPWFDLIVKDKRLKEVFNENK